MKVFERNQKDLKKCNIEEFVFLSTIFKGPKRLCLLWETLTLLKNHQIGFFNKKALKVFEKKKPKESEQITKLLE